MFTNLLVPRTLIDIEMEEEPSTGNLLGMRYTLRPVPTESPSGF